MGDRANVKFVRGNQAPMYFYTHWSGSELPEIVASALKRGKNRWDDPQYLARIIFSEMIQDSVLTETGFGLSTEVGDGDDKIVTVDADNQIVTDYKGITKSFDEIVNV